MSLQQASLQQLLQWQQDIVAELARRAAQPQAPQPPRAPWEQHHAEVAAPLDPRVAETLALQERLNAAAGAPSMLGGHGRPVLRPTFKTDPAYAAKLAETPPRGNGIPGYQGNGHGEGAVEVGPRRG